MREARGVRSVSVVRSARPFWDTASAKLVCFLNFLAGYPQTQERARRFCICACRRQGWSCGLVGFSGRNGCSLLVDLLMLYDQFGKGRQSFPRISNEKMDLLMLYGQFGEGR